MSDNAKSYSSRKNAVKGAKRDNLTDYTPTLIDGRWFNICENENGDATIGENTLAGDLDLDNVPSGDAEVESDADTLADNIDREISGDDTPDVSIDAEDEQGDKETSEDEAPEDDAELNAKMIAAHKGKALEALNADNYDDALFALQTIIAVQKGKRMPRAAAPGSYKAIRAMAPARSTVIKPVDFIFKWLDANAHDKTRSECLHALAAEGVNFSTAHTQYQRWRKKTHPKV